MTGLAGQATRVVRRCDLRKSLWLGRACRVTANAKNGGIELRWNDGWIIGVLSKRPMAGLAVDTRMFARLLHIQHVGVAGLAGIMAGEVDRAGGYLCNRRSTVVSIFAEALRHDEVANDQEDHKGNHKEKRESEEMPGVLEVDHAAVSLRAATP